MIGVTIARKWSCAPGSLPVSELSPSRIHFRRCEPHRSRRGAAGKVKGLESGADAFLTKPIDESELVAQVKAMVRIKRSEDALRKERDFLEQQLHERMEEVRNKQRLNILLLDAIPHAACLIDRTRTIVSLNRTAADEGAKAGDTCWCGFRQLNTLPQHQKAAFPESGNPLPGTKCDFCLADRAMAAASTMRTEIMVRGRCWDVRWVPITEDYYLHYTIDITDLQLSKLGESLNGNSLVEAERHAHSLKGAAATIAAATLQRTAHALEVCCRNGRVCEALEVYATLCAEMERLVTQLSGEKVNCSEGFC